MVDEYALPFQERIRIRNDNLRKQEQREAAIADREKRTRLRVGVEIAQRREIVEEEEREHDRRIEAEKEEINQIAEAQRISTARARQRDAEMAMRRDAHIRTKLELREARMSAEMQTIVEQQRQQAKLEVQLKEARKQAAARKEEETREKEDAHSQHCAELEAKREVNLKARQERIQVKNDAYLKKNQQINQQSTAKHLRFNREKEERVRARTEAAAAACKAKFKKRQEWDRLEMLREQNIQKRESRRRNEEAGHIQELQELDMKGKELQQQMSEEARAKYLAEKRAAMSAAEQKQKQIADLEAKRNAIIAQHEEGRQQRGLSYGQQLHAEQAQTKTLAQEMETRAAQVYTQQIEKKAAQAAQQSQQDKQHWKLEVRRAKNEIAKERTRTDREIERFQQVKNSESAGLEVKQRGKEQSIEMRRQQALTIHEGEVAKQERAAELQAKREAALAKREIKQKQRTTADIMRIKGNIAWKAEGQTKSSETTPDKVDAPKEDREQKETMREQEQPEGSDMQDEQVVQDQQDASDMQDEQVGPEEEVSEEGVQDCQEGQIQQEPEKDVEGQDNDGEQVAESQSLDIPAEQVGGHSEEEREEQEVQEEPEDIMQAEPEEATEVEEKQEEQGEKGPEENIEEVEN